MNTIDYANIPHDVIKAPPNRFFPKGSDKSVKEIKYTIYIDPEDEILVRYDGREWMHFAEVEPCMYICFDENDKPIFKKNSIEKNAKKVPYKYSLCYYFVPIEDLMDEEETHKEPEKWNCYIDNRKFGGVFGVYLDDWCSLEREKFN